MILFMIKKAFFDMFGVSCNADLKYSSITERQEEEKLFKKEDPLNEEHDPRKMWDIRKIFEEDKYMTIYNTLMNIYHQRQQLLNL